MNILVHPTFTLESPLTQHWMKLVFMVPLAFCHILYDNSNIFLQGSWTLEHAKLKARMEVLQRNQRYRIDCVQHWKAEIKFLDFLCQYTYICRHYMGEDLENLSLRELQNLEQQLDSALKHIRSRKVNITSRI